MFKGRHFDRSVILLCMRWYLAYRLSLRDLEEMMAERGISVDHATIHRWTLRYAPELLERFNRGWNKNCFQTHAKLERTRNSLLSGLRAPYPFDQPRSGRFSTLSR